MKTRRILHVALSVLMILSVLTALQPVRPVRAAANLTITPITWNVIGLDSNNVSVGPNNFPIGVRVCNTGDSAATNVTSAFVWDTTDTYINLRTGSYGTAGNPHPAVASLAAGACTDFYYEVTITRDAAAYNHTARYHITATADGLGTISTPTPREIFVEHLISQNRNSTTNVELDGTSIPAGGTMTLMVGNSYNIKLYGGTATNGYEQIETFINFPNTIFRINSVATTYAANGGTDPNAATKIYANGCTWENNLRSPNYRSCLGTGKYGGNVTVTYNVTIISGGGTSQTLSNLIYDFSGSSYHYNADYGVGARIAYILSPSNVTIAKTFTADAITPTGTSTMTIRITNPGTSTISGVNFSDTFPTSPGAMVVANPTGASTTGCGSPTFSPTAGAASISFSYGTLSPGATCIIKVNVTAPTAGTYTNTTGHLYINGTTPGTGTDTGNTASANLAVSTTTVACSNGTMATWTVPNGTTANPPDATGGVPNTGNKAANVSTATVSAALPGSTQLDTKTGHVDSTSWSAYGYKDGGQYVNFVIQTKNYSQVSLSFWMGNESPANGPTSVVVAYDNGDGSGFHTIDTITNPPLAFTQHTYDLTGLTSTTGTTSIRITGSGAKNNNKGSGLLFDDMTFTGCSYYPPPTLNKNFNPTTIKKYAAATDVSLLTFTVGNNQTTPYDSVPLTGVTFSDTLPSGLLIVNDVTYPAATSCINGTLSAPNGGTTISLTGTSNGGASMTAGNTCTVTVYVKGTQAGVYDNVSGYVDSYESVPNKTSTGYGSASLTVLDPPIIAKSFGATTILTGNTTSLSFTIRNPNQTTTLTELQFTDTLPTGLTVATGSSTPCNGILTTTYPTTISFSGGSLAANSSCTFNVTVTGASAGSYTNTTGNVSSTNGGTGNIATANLEVRNTTPALSLLKQVGTSISGPWYDSKIIAAGSPVYYRFLVENNGDVALNPVSITDDMLNMTACNASLPASLPAAVAANDNHIATCVVGPVTAIAGSKTNTAYATGTYGGSPYNSNNNDTATYQNGNFGHLPSAYTDMNLYNDGGAFALNGTTYLGASVRTTDTDGINTPTYTPKSTDNGVTWTGNWDSGTGYATVNATCPSGTCYLYAWADWNNDNDFLDTNEAIYAGTVVNGNNSISFSYLGGVALGAGTVVNGITSISFTYRGRAALGAGTYYTRFRVYAQQPGNPQPYGIARTAGGIPIVGEIEDPPIVSDGGGRTPTPVTVSYFRAQRQGSSVNFEWSTATETGNVGFNLYVEEGGQLTLINAELIPSQVIDSLDRQDYSYKANVNGNTFYIKDVGVLGETRLHGPFQLGQTYGGRLDEEKINWGAIQREYGRMFTSQQAALKKNLKVPAAALKPVMVGASGVQLANSLNLKVRQTGIYRVTYEMLREAGLDLAGVPTAKITLTNRGEMVPIYVEGKGKFGPGGFIEFYGEALDTIYTDTNIYTLQVSKSSAARVSGNNAAPGKGLKPPASYLETLVVNNQRAYAFYAPGEDAWYDTSMLAYKTAKSWDFTFQVDGLADPSAPASLELVVWGVTDWPQSPDHHLVVSLNGVVVADQTFNGLVEQTLEMILPAGTLKEGLNTLRLTLPGDTGVNYDLVNLDKFSLTFQRLFQARDGRLTFTAAGKVFSVTNLPSKNVVVYRMAENGLARLGQVQVKATGSTFSATFAGTNQSATYLVTATEALYTPALEAVRLQADLSRPAQYLIISHPNFINGLQPLVEARQAQGLTVSVVDVNDVYTQYTYGIFDPQAIQQYISYAVNNLGTQYVLLVGGDTRDYRNYQGRNSISFIPSLYVATGPLARFVPADPLYADLNNDNVPDLAIGRFPVRTAAELALMVNKTLAYAGKDYGRTAVFATDKYDGVVSFKNISLRLETGIPATWSVTNIHLDDMSVASARNQLIAAMNRGTALVTFTGHSGPVDWTFSNLFNVKDAAALTNAGRPFVVVQWGCWNTYYVDPANNYLVQSFLFSGDRGAAAVLGASTLTDSTSERLLGELLTPRLVLPGMSIGQALQEAKSALAQTSPNLLDVLLGWTLMGDPALVIEP